MKNPFYAYIYVASLTFLCFAKGHEKFSSTFKLANKEMRNTEGIIEYRTAESQLHCAAQCSRHEDCKAIQMSTQSTEGNCMLLDTDVAHPDEMVNSKVLYYETLRALCENKCYHGAKRHPHDCVCKCPSYPVLRGFSCEFVCEWVEYPGLKIHPDSDSNKYEKHNEQSCKDLCIHFINCMSMSLCEDVCFVNAHNTSSEDTYSVTGSREFCTAHVLQCKWQTD